MTGKKINSPNDLVTTSVLQLESDPVYGAILHLPHSPHLLPSLLLVAMPLPFVRSPLALLLFYSTPVQLRKTPDVKRVHVVHRTLSLFPLGYHSHTRLSLAFKAGLYQLLDLATLSLWLLGSTLQEVIDSSY